MKTVDELIILGGAAEIGANCCYLHLCGAGVFIDAGLHPRNRSAAAFPRMEHLGERPTDFLIVTHAHTDHLGGLPFVMKHYPHLRVITTRATRDLSEIMLRDTVKLLRSSIVDEFSSDVLSLYTRDMLQKLGLVFEGYHYEEPIELTGMRAGHPVRATLFDAGHILGSAGILAEWNGKSLLHTGDVNFTDQSLVPRAALPRRHVDTLIMESTNGASGSVYSRHEESLKLARFINDITNNNGSVLLPSFALGKTQEILKVLFDLMQAGRIPFLPVYTGGMSRKISNLYDRYCYSVRRIDPGFEVADIPQVPINYEELHRGPYLSSPAIVVASSGMLNAGTTAFALAQHWMPRRNFGIGFISYLDPNSPGYELLHSTPDKEFTLAGRTAKRSCHIEQFRFSAHSAREDLVGFVADVRPKQLFLVHGDGEACSELAYHIGKVVPSTRIFIPSVGRSYTL